MEPDETHLAAATALLHDHGEARLARTRRLLRPVLESRQGTIGLVLLVVFTLVAVLGNWIAPQNPNAPSSFSSHILAHPSWSHWLGTDENGRDVLSELILGTQTSMLVGFVAALVSTVLGTAVGVVSGYAGGWTDRLLTLLDDWFLVLPLVPVTVLAATLLGQRADSFPMGQTFVLIVVIGAFGWAGTSRIVRAEVLSLKQRTFVERSRALGASHWRIISRDILPNIAPLVLANAVIYVSLAILTESTLAYLGLGDPNRFSWGRMLDNAQGAGAMTSGAWPYVLAPGICITLAVLGFSLLGHSIEPLFDPRLRRRGR
ncbi:MAG: ABC transporter permease [Actinobacteria bacterium]|nr:ABC transporter permease [Actinomycetota bacterium]